MRWWKTLIVILNPAYVGRRARPTHLMYLLSLSQKECAGGKIVYAVASRLVFGALTERTDAPEDDADAGLRPSSAPGSRCTISPPSRYQFFVCSDTRVVGLRKKYIPSHYFSYLYFIVKKKFRNWSRSVAESIRFFGTLLWNISSLWYFS